MKSVVSNKMKDQTILIIEIRENITMNNKNNSMNK